MCLCCSLISRGIFVTDRSIFPGEEEDVSFFFHFWKMKECIWFLSLHWSGWTTTYLPSLDLVHQTSSPVRLAADHLMQTWPLHNNLRHQFWPIQSPVVMAAHCMTAFFERARVSICVINKKKMACLFLILILSSATLLHSPFPYFAICLLQFASF